LEWGKENFAWRKDINMAARYMECILIVKNWNVATIKVMELQLTSLLYTVTVNIKNVLIKMKWKDNIFVELYISEQGTIPMEFLLRKSVRMLGDRKGRNFLQILLVFISDMNVVASG
jgi:hypothetical protein